MALPLIISFFTVGTPYEHEINRLRCSCGTFDLEYSITGLETRGSWEANCAMKGPFIHEQLERAQRPVLWIDADGEVVAPLDYFVDARFDFACYVRWSVKKEPPVLNSPNAPFMSGTVFVNYTPAGRGLAECWAEKCKQYSAQWDQVLLGWAWWDLREQIEFRLLPQGYCKISDRIWREADETPFILHYQASRRFKHLVNQSEAMLSHAATHA